MGGCAPHSDRAARSTTSSTSLPPFPAPSSSRPTSASLDSKIGSVKPRFLADCNVGRLARWLRALGYDASCHPRIDHSELVREAAPYSPGLLARDPDLTKPRACQT